MPAPEWCDEHWMTLPCAGCRADQLAAPSTSAHTPDARQLAAGDS